MQGVLAFVALISLFLGGLSAAKSEDVQVVLGRARAEASAGNFAAAEADYRRALALADTPGNKSYVTTVLEVHRYFVNRGSVAEAHEISKIAAERQMRKFVSAYEIAPILVALAEDDRILMRAGERAETFGALASIWAHSEGENSLIVAHFRLAQAEAYKDATDSEKAQIATNQAIAVLNAHHGDESLAVRRAAKMRDGFGAIAVRGQDVKDFRSPDASVSNPLDVSVPQASILLKKKVTPPKLLSSIQPQYTKKAREARYEGSVFLKVVVGTDGYIEEAQVSAPLGLGLDEAAIEAVKQWKFQPGEKDGSPVRVAANVEVKFHLL